ncbi:MAG: O-antigen ligase family protein [Parcubacteria group bacterium]|nr:O-antigen ligase family protein [Parcubacteria group bacterium]
MRSKYGIEWWLRAVIIGGIFLLPFIPFIVTKSMFFPFIVGKNFAFRIIIEIIFASWIVLAFRDVQYRLKFSWIFAALATFVGVVFVADIFGQDFLRSFWSNYERMDGFITTLHLFVLFIVAAPVMNTKQLWTRFLQTSLGASAIMSFYGILQLAGKIVINQGGVRVDGTLGNATYLAGYLLLHIFFAAFLLAQKNIPNWLKGLYGAIIALHVFMLFNTMTRGAILALIGGTILTALLFIFFGKHAPTLKKYAAGVLGGIVLLMGIFIAIKDTNFVRQNQALDRLAGISLDAGKSRFLVWGVAWEGIKEHPLLGWGQDNFIVAFGKHYDPKMYTEEPWFDRAHNVFVDWLVAGGALALLSYLSIFIVLIYGLWFYPLGLRKIEEQKRTGEGEYFSVFEKSILTGLFGAYLFHNFFVFDNVISYIFFFSMLAFVHQASAGVKPSALHHFSWVKMNLSGNEFMNRFVGPITVIMLVLSLYVGNIKHMLGNRALLHGIDLRAAQEAGAPESREMLLRGNFQSFQKSIESGFLGRAETREQLSQITGNLVDAPISQVVRQEFFTLANTEMKKQIEETPENLRPRIFLGTLLIRYRLFDEAIIELEKALTVSDKKQDIYYLLANTYLNTGNTGKALEVAKRALDLEPNNDRALKIYASLLIRVGRTTEAEEMLKGFIGDDYSLNPDIVNAYVSIGRFDKLITFREEQIKNEPQNLEAYVSLSAAYLELGERNKAVAQIEMAIELFPEFKEQGEYFIREIRAGRNP